MRHKPARSKYLRHLPCSRPCKQRRRRGLWGLPEELIVIWIRRFQRAHALLDVIRSAADHDFEATLAGTGHFATYDRFQVGTNCSALTELPRSDRREILARKVLRGSLYETSASPRTVRG